MAAVRCSMKSRRNCLSRIREQVSWQDPLTLTILTMIVTGICECTSGIGPLLGGGHSMLQGRYGFSADNLASARVVLADGSAVTASATENTDLFWALRGAGHNFGIVTSYDLKLYEVGEDWTMIALSFKQDKLEEFFDTWNQLEDEHEDAGTLVLNGVMARNEQLDPDQVCLSKHSASKLY